MPVPADLAEAAETQLRCQALYASTLADALTNARLRDSARLARVRPTAVRGLIATCTATRHLLRESLAKMDRELADRTHDVAEVIRNRPSS